MSELVEKLAEQYGWSSSVPNLSDKLRRESLRYKEAVELADALGYVPGFQRCRLGAAGESRGQPLGDSPVVLAGAQPAGNIALVPVRHQMGGQHFPEIIVDTAHIGRQIAGNSAIPRVQMQQPFSDFVRHYIGTLTIVLVIAIGRGGEQQIARQYSNMSAETIYVNLSYSQNMDFASIPRITSEHLEIILEENPYLKGIYLRTTFFEEVKIGQKKSK